MTKELCKRMIALLLALVALTGVAPEGPFFSTTARACGPSDLLIINAETLADGPKVIEDRGTYLVTGEFSGNGVLKNGLIRVETAEPVTLILDGAIFTTTGAKDWSPLMIGTATNGATSSDPAEPDVRADVTIILAAGSANTFRCDSTLTPSASRTAGIDVALGSTLTIRSEDELTNPGKLTAIGGHYAAGIGSGPNKQCGTIIIESGIICAESSQATSPNGANSGPGIGGGGANSYNGGHSEGITICGTAVVTAISYGNGAGIGGGGGGGSERMHNGMIGPGQGGTIEIFGDAVVEATSKGHGAGIGGGGGTTASAAYGGAGGDITISGSATVKATSEYSAGIGGGGRAIEGGDGGSITISDTPIVVAETSSVYAAAVDMGPGISTSYALGAPGEITIIGGNLYAPRTTEVTNGAYGDTVTMKKVTPAVPAEERSSFNVIGTSGNYTYEALSDGSGETYVWLPENSGNLTITVTDAAGAPLAGSAVGVAVDGVSLNNIPATDADGEVRLVAALGEYSISASHSGYQSANAVIILSGGDAAVQIALARINSGGSGSGDSGTPDASLTILCVDEDGSTIYTQTLSAVTGKTEAIYAPPLKGYSLAQGEPSSRTHRIVSGSNVVTFHYVADKIELEEPRVPTGDGNRPLVSNAIRETLETDEHIQYIHGFTDGTVRPDSNISRAEVAAIFWRLVLDADKNNAIGNRFDDVSGDAWYAQAVSYLAEHGIITGYEDGTFRPTHAITRAEFAAMISRFDTLGTADVEPFVDVTKEHWAHDYVISAYQMGWMSGYPTREFRPESPITRAEVVMIVNRMLGRGIQAKDIPTDLHSLYPDLSVSHWAFAEMIEASVEHDYERLENGYEIHISR